jgi:phage antirepressor YoqD-like protein
MAAKAEDTPEQIMARALMIAQDTLNRQKQQLKEAENQVKAAAMLLEAKEEQLHLSEQTIQKQAPKVEYCDRVLQCEDLIPVTVIAKELGMSGQKLNSLLKQKGIIYYIDGTWVLYSRYQNKGYTGTRTHTYYDSLGKERSKRQTYWTENGRAFIHQLWKGGAL